MQKRNFQKELDGVLAALAAKGETPTLLLHSCCAPCSSYCLLYLSQYFKVTVFYYNPNITDEAEYRRRVQEQKRLICAYNERIAKPINWIEGDYAPDRFFAAAKGLELAPEGGARCKKCFALRLNETAALAAKEGFDYFTTTLTISPLKDAALLNEIGEQAAREQGAVWLPSDFKKRGGYQQSIALSREYELYRQDYCGCIFSKRETAQKKAEKSAGHSEKEASMAQLWGGRFTKETDKLVYNFNASIGFDKRMYRQDIAGSIAHVTMLAKQGVLKDAERDAIVAGLNGILTDVENGTLAITDEYEDIHSFVEANLIARIGDVGKKLHTGRSRNDQVALDMRLYIRDEIDTLRGLLLELLRVLITLMEENTETIMPGFTHLQKAQPITLAHHLGAYFEMFKRDHGRLADVRARMNECPLGAGALAGTTYPLDRAYTAKLLGFDRATANSMDSVSDRDYLIELLSAMATSMMHLSRFSEEVIIWNTNEYRFVEIDDAYSTGSSIMPQKKNPDIAELVRGKTGRVYGALMALLTTMKGLPLAYNKDMQEDKELVYDAIDTTKGCIALFTGMLKTMHFRKDVMEASAKGGFTNATDAADYLVGRGVPFRDAHGVIGKLVLYCIEKNCPLEALSLEEFQKFSPAFDADIYDAISMETCVNKRLTKGAPGKAAMQEEIADARKYLAAQTKA